MAIIVCRPWFFKEKSIYGKIKAWYTCFGDGMQQFVTKNAAETLALGVRLGEALRSGGRVVALFGPMGMGKTVFVSGVARGMGLSDAVSSPTFSIVNVYGANDELCHFDMYRVDTWEDLASTGFFEYMDAGSVLCVEWSENIENALPEDAIRVTLAPGAQENERIITVEGVKL